MLKVPCITVPGLLLKLCSRSLQSIKIQLRQGRALVKVSVEEEITRILPTAHRLQVPVTFRAAGTSLSGGAGGSQGRQMSLKEALNGHFSL